MSDAKPKRRSGSVEPEEEEDEIEEPLLFPPEEEADLVGQADTFKKNGNTLFAASEWDKAVEEYNQALKTYPNYLHFELSVIHSNIAACFLKAGKWDETVKAADKCLENLDILERISKGKEKEKSDEPKAETENEREPGVKLDPSPTTEANLQVSDGQRPARTSEEIKRIRAKGLMRRARARTEKGGWSALQGALDDYTALKSGYTLPPQDNKIVETQLRRLPPLVTAAKDKEVGEMMGKLKDLGNGILKPFGLSTDNFNMVQDPKTGGYSMNFNQNSGK